MQQASSVASRKCAGPLSWPATPVNGAAQVVSATSVWSESGPNLLDGGLVPPASIRALAHARPRRSRSRSADRHVRSDCPPPMRSGSPSAAPIAVTHHNPNGAHRRGPCCRAEAWQAGKARWKGDLDDPDRSVESPVITGIEAGRCSRGLSWPDLRCDPEVAMRTLVGPCEPRSRPQPPAGIQAAKAASQAGGISWL